jgi:hypothetical protein
MEKLEKFTIPGAEFDSSARDPPPRCHPGTRLAIVREIHDFLNDENRERRRLLWLVGKAGVGKSAIMQTIAENCFEETNTSGATLGASLFFSINGRNDPAKSFITLAYQLAVAHPPYCNFVREKIARDPKLPTKAVKAQFTKLFIEPFVQKELYHGMTKPFLILVDGLDECQGEGKQAEIVGLIAYLSLVNPEVPLIWIIASRPEPHLTSTFARPNVAPTCNTIEVAIDSTEACADVERFLRDELERIRLKYPALAMFSRWPAENHFLKLAAAAGGLFAYASTAIRFIDDLNFGDPTFQLQQILDVIDNVPINGGGESAHPMAHLDALYTRILSRIPRSVMHNTKKLLLIITHPNFVDRPLAEVCDWLKISLPAIHGALHHLHSVLDVPQGEESEWCALRPAHKSFRDFIFDLTRSGIFSADYESEQSQLVCDCALAHLQTISASNSTCAQSYSFMLLM